MTPPKEPSSEGASAAYPGHAKAVTALKSLARQAGEILKAQSRTLSIAESLTGGWIAAAVTSVSGSSGYFAGSVVAYSNQMKERLLKVREETLAAYGAVSAQCSKEMARGARAVMGTDLGLSSTGIAGPMGGSPLKPVGLVYLTVVDSSRFITVERRFSGNRLAVTFQAAREALVLLATFLNPSGEGLSPDIGF
jgi:PncC family amidohydrolase